MTPDRSYKILLSVMTMLLCANLLVALRARPGQAQPAKVSLLHYQVVHVDSRDREDEIAHAMNSKANDGYRFKGMMGDHNGGWIILEK